MTALAHASNTVRNRPFLVGTLTVLAVLGGGIGIGIAGGFSAPLSASAEISGDDPCCDVREEWGFNWDVGYSVNGLDSGYYGGGGGSIQKTPECTLSANPNAIEDGESSTLSWTSKSAVSASINQGIGSVTPVGAGSTSVSPSETKQYTMTVTSSSGKTATCKTTVTVTPPPEPPVCTLSANPSEIVSGGASVLSWTTENATSFTIDNGVGSVSPVSLGSISVYPTQYTYYTGTATGPGGTSTCMTKVKVKMPPPNAPTCTLSANPNAVNQGDSSSLTWTTTNATAATIDHLVGPVTPVSGGSTSVTPAVTKTYTLTATGPGGTITCAATITVTPPPPALGCIRVLKETYDTNSNPLTPVAQFTFTLDGSETAFNDATGQAIFSNVTPGTHTVTELVPPTWTQLSVTPVNGTVVVAAGPNCAAVVFKNKQVITTPNAPTCTLSANPTEVQSGGTSTLTWTTTNATEISTNNDGFDLSNGTIASGNDVVTVASTTTYTLTAKGPGGTVSCNASVKVKKTPGQCNMEITKSADRTTALKDDVVEYTISFKNIGTADCTGGGVKVYDSVDSRLTYLSETHSSNVSAGYSGPVWNASDRTLRWNAHELAPGETGWVKWKGKFAKPSECSEIVPNKAKITAKELNNFQTWIESNSVEITLTKDCAPPPPPEPIKIKATKIVCDKESDLPNWSGTSNNITETTAAHYVASHPGCHLESDWKFEWANAGTPNPGDNIEAGGAPWTVFGPTDASGVAMVSIPVASTTGDRIWVREQLKSGYIPFTGLVVDNKTAELYCGTDVLNYDNYDFVKDPEAGKTYHCVAWNAPKPPPPGAPACTLVADLTVIEEGGSSKLTWTTTNVVSASINQGIGNLSPVSGGFVSVSPTESTNYVLTALGENGDTVTCGAEVNVRIIPPGPICTLTADKSTIEKGDEVTLSWTSQNTDTLVFDQGIGSTTPLTGGTKVVEPDEDTMYTGTWTGPGGTVTCSVEIKVDKKGLACEMSVSPTSINKGESASLSWSGTNIVSVVIDNGIGSRPAAGSETVTPSDPGSYTYHGEFTSDDGQTIHCSTSLEVKGEGCTSNCGGGGGGGSRKPRVSFTSFEPEGEVLASYVYLSEVPYTGLDLGPVGTVFYWLMLAVWSAAAAYLVLFNLVPFTFRRMKYAGEGMRSMLGSTARNVAPSYAPAMVPAAVDLPGSTHEAFDVELPEAPRGYSTHEGFRSFATDNGLTIDDVVNGLARTETKTQTAATYPQAVMASDVPPMNAYDDTRAHPAYDAWKSASMGNKVEPIYTSVEPIYENVEPIIPPSIPRSAYQNVASVAPSHGIHEADVHSFLDALLSADREATFGFLRQMTRSGIAVEKFLTRALHALDDAFRARVEGGTCNPEVLRITGKCSTPALETLVSSLTHAVDGSYSKGMTGAKLALTRALDSIEG